MTNEPTPQEAIDKEVLLQYIEDAIRYIEWHQKQIEEKQELLRIYNNQLNQLN